MNSGLYKVLVCDDDYDILDITSMLLEYEGFKVITQIDSNKLIDQALKEQPDVMLVDIRMPLPGNVIAKQMKQMPQLAHIPIVLFSAEIDAHKIAFKSGADGFIEKPFDADNLASVIRSLIRINRSESI